MSTFAFAGPRDGPRSRWVRAIVCGVEHDRARRLERGCSRSGLGGRRGATGRGRWIAEASRGVTGLGGRRRRGSRDGRLGGIAAVRAHGEVRGGGRRGEGDGREGERLEHGRWSFGGGRRGIDTGRDREAGDGEEHTTDEILARAAQRPLDERVHAVGEVTSPAREPLRRRRLGDAERRRDVADGATVAVIQHQHLAVGLGHARERVAHHAIDLGLRGRVERAIARRGQVVVERGGVLAASPRLAREVARDAAQPGAQRAGLAQLTELAPRRDERVLRHVLAEAPVSGRAVRDRADQILVARDEPAERGVLAAQARLDERRITGHRDPFHVGE